MMAVGSESVSFAGETSPPPETVAEFVTDDGAFGATSTLRLKRALSPAAMTPPNVALTCWPVALNAQFVPKPLENVSPAGSASCTVIVPDDGPEPMLLTTMM